MSEQRGLMPGLEGKAQLTVSEQHLASTVGSGLVRVFSTPMMIALMEHAAANAVHALLQEGETTVGTRLDVRHLAPTPLGMHVRAYAKLTHVEGQVLTFDVWAEDEQECIGEGMHQRAIIERARFERRVQEKVERSG